MRLLRGHRRRFQYGFPRGGQYCSREGFPRCFPDCSRMVSLRFPASVFGNKRLRKLCLSTVSGVGFLFGFHTSKGKTILPQTGKTGLPLDMEIIPTQQAILDTLHFCLDFVIIHALYDLYYPVSMDYTDLLLSYRYHH